MADFDKEQALRELGIPGEIYDELVADLFKQAEKQLGELERTVPANDAQRTASLAHSIKGASANLRLHAMRAAAETLEKGAKGEIPGADLSAALAALKAAADRTRAALGIQ